MAYGIQLRELPTERLASVRSRQSIADLGRLMEREFGHIMTALAHQGLYPTGPPVAIYHSWSEDSVDVELGFPIVGEFQEADGVFPSELPAGKVASTIFVGRYEDIEKAYEAIQAWAKENGLELAEMMWERYFTSPEEEPDLSKHVTEVFWPVK